MDNCLQFLCSKLSRMFNTLESSCAKNSGAFVSSKRIFNLEEERSKKMREVAIIANILRQLAKRKVA